jgi:hypothetical protein
VKLFVGVLVALAIVACAAGPGPSIVAPATGPGTAYPCGIGGHFCNHRCCASYEACLGTPPACEFQGDSIYDKKRDGGR